MNINETVDKYLNEARSKKWTADERYKIRKILSDVGIKDYFLDKTQVDIGNLTNNDRSSRHIIFITKYVNNISMYIQAGDNDVNLTLDKFDVIKISKYIKEYIKKWSMNI